MKLPKVFKSLSPDKARKILDAGQLDGKKLNRKQVAFYKMVASGDLPRRLNDIPRSQRGRIAA